MGPGALYGRLPLRLARIDREQDQSGRAGGKSARAARKGSGERRGSGAGAEGKLGGNEKVGA